MQPTDFKRFELGKLTKHKFNVYESYDNVADALVAQLRRSYDNNQKLNVYGIKHFTNEIVKVS